METSDIKHRLESALAKFQENDSLLIQERAHERAICFRLGYYLQQLFNEHVVDAEYDRTVGKAPGPRSKKVLPNTSQGDKGIFPDLLIHKRGIHDHNLLVVEVKKVEELRDADWDREKLERLAQPPYCYKVTAFVIVDRLESSQPLRTCWGGASIDCATQQPHAPDAAER